MGPASLQKDSEPPPQQSEGEMESYRCLLQAGSQLESTVQREYATLMPPRPRSTSGCRFRHLVCTRRRLELRTSLIYEVFFLCW